MAGISVGPDKAGRRRLDQDVPLLPFVDLLVCLIAFLMVTAVWARLSRLESSALAPGGATGPSTEPAKELHLVASSSGFELRWQRGATVLETRHVAKVTVPVGGEPRFPALSEAISREWSAQGEHRDASDEQRDHAVLHLQNDVPFAEVVAVLDALQAPRRAGASAFDVALAAN